MPVNITGLWFEEAVLEKKDKRGSRFSQDMYASI